MTHNGTLNLSDYDFGVEAVRRSRTASTATLDLWDGLAKWKNRGGTRKTSSYQLDFQNFWRKTNKELESVAIGRNKFKRGTRLVMVFNNKALANVSAPLHKPSKESDTPTVFSKAHVQKIFDEFGITTPDKPGTAAILSFKLEAIEGQPNVYLVVPGFLDLWDSAGTHTRRSIAGVVQVLKS